MIASPLIVAPCPNASSRASVTDRPELLVPSPEMSMIRRFVRGVAAANRSIAKSMAPLIDVRPIKERGAARMAAARPPASSSSWMMVQSATTFCSPAPDHSTKHIAIVPVTPPRIAARTRGSVTAAGYPLRCRANSLSSMLRDTSAANTSSRSVAWARAPSEMASKAANIAAVSTEFIRGFLAIDGADKPGSSVAEGHRQRPLATPYLRTKSIADAHRPNTPVDRHRAPRDQRDHRRGRTLDRKPARLDRPAHYLHSPHFRFAADPGKRVAGRPARSRCLSAADRAGGHGALPSQRRRARRHAGPYQERADPNPADHPRYRRTAAARHLAGHLPSRASRLTPPPLPRADVDRRGNRRLILDRLRVARPVGEIPGYSRGGGNFFDCSRKVPLWHRKR